MKSKGEKMDKDPKGNAQKVYGITDAKGKKIFNKIMRVMKKTKYKSDTIDALFPKLSKEQRYTIFLHAEIQHEKGVCCSFAQVEAQVIRKLLGNLGAIEVGSSHELIKKIQDIEAGKPQHE